MYQRYYFNWKTSEKCPSFCVVPKLSIWNKTSRGINYFFLLRFLVSFLNPKEIYVQESISHPHTELREVPLETPLNTLIFYPAAVYQYFNHWQQDVAFIMKHFPLGS